MLKTWNIEPVQVAAMVIEQFPYEAEQIALDFLEGAANAGNPNTTLFWTVVLNHIEQMQKKLYGESGYGPEIRFNAVM
ncbi:MAG TPA: hypothetical protein VGH23_08050 [Rhizomicrobium sp.]